MQQENTDGVGALYDERLDNLDPLINSDGLSDQVKCFLLNYNNNLKKEYSRSNLKERRARGKKLVAAMEKLRPIEDKSRLLSILLNEHPEWLFLCDGYDNGLLHYASFVPPHLPLIDVLIAIYVDVLHDPSMLSRCNERGDRADDCLSLYLYCKGVKRFAVLNQSPEELAKKLNKGECEDLVTLLCDPVAYQLRFRGGQTAFHLLLRHSCLKAALQVLESLQGKAQFSFLVNQCDFMGYNVTDYVCMGFLPPIKFEIQYFKDAINLGECIRSHPQPCTEGNPQEEVYFVQNNLTVDQLDALCANEQNGSPTQWQRDLSVICHLAHQFCVISVAVLEKDLYKYSALPFLQQLVGQCIYYGDLLGRVLTARMKLVQDFLAEHVLKKGVEKSIQLITEKEHVPHNRKSDPCDDKLYVDFSHTTSILERVVRLLHVVAYNACNCSNLLTDRVQVTKESDSYNIDLRPCYYLVYPVGKHGKLHESSEIEALITASVQLSTRERYTEEKGNKREFYAYLGIYDATTVAMMAVGLPLLASGETILEGDCCNLKVSQQFFKWEGLLESSEQVAHRIQGLYEQNELAIVGESDEAAIRKLAQSIISSPAARQASAELINYFNPPQCVSNLTHSMSKMSITEQGTNSERNSNSSFSTVASASVLLQTDHKDGGQ